METKLAACSSQKPWIPYASAERMGGEGESSARIIGWFQKAAIIAARRDFRCDEIRQSQTYTITIFSLLLLCDGRHIEEESMGMYMAPVLYKRIY